MAAAEAMIIHCAELVETIFTLMLRIADLQGAGNATELAALTACTAASKVF